MEEKKFIILRKVIYFPWKLLLTKLVKDFIKPILKISKEKNSRNRNPNYIPKQMIQTSPIAPTQVKAANPSEHLLNDIRQIKCSLYHRKKKILKRT